MNRIATLLFLLTIAMHTFGQERLLLWEGTPPYNKTEISVEEVNENYRIAKVSQPELYHYQAKAEGEVPKPAIVIVPGGGYARQAFDHEGIMVAEWFAERGFEAFVLKYRLPDEEIIENSSFVPLMDGQQAIYYVRSNADKFNIDPAMIGIIGFSAGGHLAASVSTLFNNPVNNNLLSGEVRPDFSVLIYPVISMDERYTHGGSRANLLGGNPEQELIDYFSLEKQVSAETPRTFMVHALDDKAVVVANSDIYAANLHALGGDVTKLILPAGGHGFGFRASEPVAYWTQYLELWLKTRILSE